MLPAILPNLVANENGLRVFCDGRGRCVDLDVAMLIDGYGPAMPPSEIGRRSRRTSCSQKGQLVQVVAVSWRVLEYRTQRGF
jgi:hypothetical protein